MKDMTVALTNKDRHGDSQIYSTRREHLAPQALRPASTGGNTPPSPDVRFNSTAPDTTSATAPSLNSVLSSPMAELIERRHGALHANVYSGDILTTMIASNLSEARSGTNNRQRQPSTPAFAEVVKFQNRVPFTLLLQKDAVFTPQSTQPASATNSQPNLHGTKTRPLLAYGRMRLHSASFMKRHGSVCRL